MPHQETATDALTGATFNDYEKLNTTPMGLETKGELPKYSTQVCIQHAKEYKMADGLDEGVGSGTCGVVGCENEAAHFYYFTAPKGSRRTTSPAAPELESESFSGLPLITPMIPGAVRTPRKRRAAPREPGAGIAGVE